MFGLKPEIIEIINRNRIKKFKNFSKLKDQPLVIVSVFGQNDYNNNSGRKRAFRLILDSFGKLSLFSDTDTDTDINLTRKEDQKDEEKLIEDSSSATKDNTEILIEKDKENLKSNNELELEQSKEEESEKILTKDNEEESEELTSKQSNSNNSNSVPDLSFLFDNEDDKENGSSSSTKDCEKDLSSKASEEGEGKEESFFDDDLIDENKDNDLQEYIDGFYYEEESILFLQLSGAFEPNTVLEGIKNINMNQDFTSFWTDCKAKYYHSLLLLFSLSHILIISNPDSVFDTHYINLFRILDAGRQYLYEKITLALSKVKNLPLQWIENARICSPRVLFLFEFEIEFPKDLSRSEQKAIYKEKAEILKEEVYQILRKCRIITNISANSLFALPRNPEYIFIFNKSYNSDGLKENSLYTFYNFIQNACTNPNIQDTSSSRTNILTLKQRLKKTQSISYRDFSISFKEFILAHSRIALRKGFSDNSKRLVDAKYFFVIPTFAQWISAYIKMSNLLIYGNEEDSITFLKRQINVDSEYLEIQCEKIFPMVFGVYQKNLPEIYSKQLHQSRLKYCINLFCNITRVGPVVFPWLKRLTDKAESYWKNRRQCETLSLSEYSCTNPMHNVLPIHNLEILPCPEIESSLPITPHNTGYRITSYCNCGRKQVNSRQEPFTIKEANYDFYKRESVNCCDRFDSFQFPIFTPEKDSNAKELSLQEMLNIIKSKPKTHSPIPNGLIGWDILDIENASQAMENELRQEIGIVDDEEDEDAHSQELECDKEDDEEEEEEDEDEEELDDEVEVEELEGAILSKKKELPKSPLSSELFEKNDYNSISQETNEGNNSFPSLHSSISKVNRINYTNSTIISNKINDENASVKESKDNNNKGSKFEFLPGMLNSKSHIGLLPLFSSWHLLCLGSSSLYSHNTGIHQNGFISGSNFLLPWDVLVKAEAGVSKPIPRLIRGKRPTHRAKRLTDEFTVKIFFGMEYECKKGHRFILQAPDKIVSLGYNNPTTKEVNIVLRSAATKVANSDMPLYFKCPCNRDQREGREIMGQLIRVHIVTPKAPVHILINPRVQPAPSPNPIFFPIPDNQGIRLTQSSYWILRIPYSFVSEEQVYVPPKDSTDYAGKLLKGLFEVIAMSKNETREWETQNLVT